MKKIRSEQRRARGMRRSPLTRAERNAEARRSRAHSHLQRVRGQVPKRPPLRAIFVAGVVLAVVAGAISGGSLANGTSWLGSRKLASIRVRGADQIPAAEIAVATGLARSADLTAVEPEAVARELESHPWVAKARALPLPTGTLLIDVTEVVPRGLVRAGSPETTYLVDGGGTPFAVADATASAALPRVEVAGGAVPFEANEGIAAALQLASDLAAHGLAEPVEIFVAAEEDQTGFSLRLAGLPARIILGREDLDSKLRELARLLAADVPGLGDAAELDLRFAGQAVLRDARPRKGAAQAAKGRGRAASST